MNTSEFLQALNIKLIYLLDHASNYSVSTSVTPDSILVTITLHTLSAQVVITPNDLDNNLSLSTYVDCVATDLLTQLTQAINPVPTHKKL